MNWVLWGLNKISMLVPTLRILKVEGDVKFKLAEFIKLQGNAAPLSLTVRSHYV